MPQVPRIQSQVQTSTGPDFRVNTSANRDAFGLGAGSQAAREGIVDLAKSIKNNADHVAVLEAENKLTEFENKYLYDPENGMFLKKGKDAFDLPKNLKEEYDKINSQIADSLSNPEQKFAFMQKSQAKRSELEKQTNRHVGVQIQEYDDQVTNSMLELERNAAVNSYQDPDRIFMSIDKQKQEIMKYGDRHGLPTEMITAKVQDAESKTHAGIVSRMLTNQDDVNAEAYFEANKKYLTPNHLEQVQKELEIGVMRGKSQRFVDAVMAQGYDYETAIGKAGQEFEANPKLREAVESRIDRVFSLKDKAEREKQENLYKYAASQFDKEGNFDTLDPKVIAAMTPEKRKELASYTQANPIRDDGVVYYKLRQLAENPKTRDKFADYDLTREFGNLSKDNRNKLIELQDSLRGKDGKADKELDGSLSDAQIMADVFKSAGYKKDEDLAKFRQVVDAEILKRKQDSGKYHLNNDEVRAIANKYAVDVVTSKGFIWDTKKPRFNLDIKDVPADDRKNIEEALRVNGKPVTDSAIMNLFLKKAKANESR